MFQRLAKTRIVLDRPDNAFYRDALHRGASYHRNAIEEIRGRLAPDGAMDLPVVWRNRKGLRMFHHSLPFADVCGRIEERHLDFLRFGSEMADAWNRSTPAERAAAKLRDAFTRPASAAFCFFGTDIQARIRRAQEQARYIIAREQLIWGTAPLPLVPEQHPAIAFARFEDSGELFPALEAIPPEVEWQLTARMKREAELDYDRSMLARKLTEITARLVIGYSDAF